MFENDNSANETDVREELVGPLLEKLGYSRNSQNSISRELTIGYSKEQLGRRKPSDRPLRGRLDYLLSVTGVARWVLEVKGPSECIDNEAVGQALSYSKHPEVSAVYAVVTNGKLFNIYSSNQVATDEPILSCVVESVERLGFLVSGLLSPKAIRRKHTLPKFEVGEPIAYGYSSSAAIVGGFAHYSHATSTIDPSSDPIFANNARENLREITGYLSGYRANITGGSIYRDAANRIVTKLKVAMERQELMDFSAQKGIADAQYICLDQYVSNEVASPSAFDVGGACETFEDDYTYDVIHRQTVQIGVPATMSYTGRATGYLVDDEFRGIFSVTNDFQVNAAAHILKYGILTRGHFVLKIG